MQTDNSSLSRDPSGVWELTLHRPPVNALTAETLGAVSDLVGAAGSDPACRALVVRSDLKVFCAGMDLRQAVSFDKPQEVAISRAFTETYAALYRFPKPMVCAVNGAAIAGGFFFVVAADLRLSAPEATYSIAEVQVGARLPVGALEIARAELTPASFRRLLLSGEPVDAQTALIEGIVDQIEPLDSLLTAARHEAEKLARLPTDAYAATKADLRAPALERIEMAIAAGAHAPDRNWFLPGTRKAISERLT